MTLVWTHIRVGLKWSFVTSLVWKIDSMPIGIVHFLALKTPFWGVQNIPCILADVESNTYTTESNSIMKADRCKVVCKTNFCYWSTIVHKSIVFTFNKHTVRYICIVPQTIGIIIFNLLIIITIMTLLFCIP